MCDSLLCGGHDSVVGSNDDDCDIGNLSTTGTHGGEGLVTRCVEECYAASVLKLHVVSTDVLGDASCLTGDDVGLAYVVEQRCLTVVNVSHDGHDRSARHEIVLVVSLFCDGLLHLCTDIFGLEPKLLCHEVDGLGVEALVDRHHDAHAHERSDDLVDVDVHHRSQLAHGHELGELQCFALLLLLAALLVHLLLSSFTLLLTILGALLCLVLLVCEACKRLLNLTCHVLIINLNGLLVAVAVLLFLSVAGAAVSAGTVAAAVVVASTLLVRRSVYVDAHLVYALALLLAVALLLSLLLTLLALLLLRLFLGTGALVERCEVDLSEHVHLRSVQHLLLALCGEDVIALLLLCQMLLLQRCALVGGLVASSYRSLLCGVGSRCLCCVGSGFSLGLCLLLLSLLRLGRCGLSLSVLCSRLLCGLLCRLSFCWLGSGLCGVIHCGLLCGPVVGFCRVVAHGSSHVLAVLSGSLSGRL